MLLPGGILMLVIIVVPAARGGVMSLLDLDQYTLRSWLQAPFIGLGNYVEAVTASPLLHSIGISVGVRGDRHGRHPADRRGGGAGHAEPVPRAAALVRSLFLIPYVAPGVRRRHAVAHDAAARRRRRHGCSARSASTPGCGSTGR